MGMGDIVAEEELANLPSLTRNRLLCNRVANTLNRAVTKIARNLRVPLESQGVIYLLMNAFDSYGLKKNNYKIRKIDKTVVFSVHGPDEQMEAILMLFKIEGYDFDG
jgi:hypothetical protein